MLCSNMLFGFVDHDLLQVVSGGTKSWMADGISYKVSGKIISRRHEETEISHTWPAKNSIIDMSLYKI